MNPKWPACQLEANDPSGRSWTAVALFGFATARPIEGLLVRVQPANCSEF